MGLAKAAFTDMKANPSTNQTHFIPFWHNLITKKDPLRHLIAHFVQLPDLPGTSPRSDHITARLSGDLANIRNKSGTGGGGGGGAAVAVDSAADSNGNGFASTFLSLRSRRAGTT